MHTQAVSSVCSHACVRGDFSHTFFPFILEAFTQHSCPETLEKSVTVEETSVVKATQIRNTEHLASVVKHNNTRGDHLS